MYVLAKIKILNINIFLPLLIKAKDVTSFT